MARIVLNAFNSVDELSNVDAVVLSDRTGAYGIKRNDTGASVVAANTVMTNIAVGQYEYVFTPPDVLVEYTIWIKATYNGTDSYQEVLYTPPAELTTYSSVADIVWLYLISVAALFTDPTNNALWPLYNGRLPDTDDIADDAAVVFSTSGIIHGPTMDGTQHQHYGFQLRVRAVDENDAYEKLQNVVTALLAMHNQTVTVLGDATYRLSSFNQASDIVTILLDAKGRSHVIVNMTVAYERM